MDGFLTVVVGGLFVYIGYLHLQLYISRRVIASLRSANVTLSEKPATSDYRPMLAALFGLALVALVLVSNLK